MHVNSKGLLLGIGLFTLFLSQGAWADENGLEAVEVESIVVTATSTEKSLKEAPGAVEIITSQDIADMNAQNLAEAVENATGLVVTTQSGRNKTPSIRGTNANQTLILIDGRRLADGFKSYTGMEQIPVDMIDHIEVVRGTASALYGSDAIGGVINVITRKTPKKLALEAGGQVGQTGYKNGELVNGHALAGNRFGNVGLLLAGSVKSQNGYNKYGEEADDMDETLMKSIAGRASLDISPDHQVSSGFEYVHKNSEGYRYLESADRNRDADDDRFNIFVEYDGKPTQTSNLMLRANHSQHESDIEITPETSNVSGIIGDDGHATRELEQFEGRYSITCFQKHLVTIGAEARKESREDDDGLDNSVENVSGLVQDEYQITDQFYLLFGGRMDDNSDFGSYFTPRVSATYEFTNHFRVKGSVGKGFRAPDINELYVTGYKKKGQEIYQNNEDLEPEESVNYEISFEGEIQKFHGRITGFQNDIDDLIDSVFDYSVINKKGKTTTYYTWQNIDEARIRGVEFELGVDLPHGFDLSGNMTYLDTENKETGEALEDRPEWAGQAKLGYTNKELGLRTSLRFVYTGESEDSTEDDSVSRFDFKISKALGEQTNLYLGMKNIFNSNVEDGEEPMCFYAGFQLKY
ncbi:TonB-dependent receptor plug domain-containing protein [Desulfobacter sp.]|uniref:TonB-dependent receptor plug domain-containing protein n=1 Tax=Desulfobacter sp. TaxID=2294 RepID=UPI003D09664F